jgi:spermidine/putrescine transport system permease protein
MSSQRSRPAFPWLLSPAVLWLVCFFILPLGLAVAMSFATRHGASVRWESSLQGWRDAFKEVHVKILTRTLWYAVLTTAFCLLLALPVCFFIAKRPPKLRRLLYGLVLLPMAANSLSLVYAWKSLLYQEGLVGQGLAALSTALGKCHPSLAFEAIYNTGRASILGMIYYYVPFMIYPIYTALERVEPRMLEAAADLGASRWQSFRHVVLPLIGRGIGTGSVLVFIQSLGSYVIPDILAGNKEMLAGTLIQQKFVGAAANWPLGAALALLLVTMIGLGLLFYFRWQRDETEIA